jgi:hypothetical protein
MVDPNIDQSDVAILSSDIFDIKEKFFDIDIGVYDYVLKCIDGPFIGKFVFINTSPLGEVIGGTTDYDIQTNP